MSSLRKEILFTKLCLHVREASITFTTAKETPKTNSPELRLSRSIQYTRSLSTSSYIIKLDMKSRIVTNPAVGMDITVHNNSYGFN